MSELSDEVLSYLGELRSAIVIVSVPFVLTLQNNISLWLQLLVANAWLFSADEVVLVEGVAVVVKQNFLRERLGQQVLFVKPAAMDLGFLRRQKSKCYSMPDSA